MQLRNIRITTVPNKNFQQLWNFCTRRSLFSCWPARLRLAKTKISMIYLGNNIFYCRRGTPFSERNLMFAENYFNLFIERLSLCCKGDEFGRILFSINFVYRMIFWKVATAKSMVFRRQVLEGIMAHLTFHYVQNRYLCKKLKMLIS